MVVTGDWWVPALSIAPLLLIPCALERVGCITPPSKTPSISQSLMKAPLKLSHALAIININFKISPILDWSCEI